MNQSKKRVFITIAAAAFLVLAVGLVLYSTGTFAGTTKEFRSYKSFAKRSELGMSRQEVFDKLGCPDCLKDSDGYYHSVMYDDIEGLEAGISADTSTEWHYDCHEFPDPANPYRLKIAFDGEGRSESIEFDYVPGG